jgi:hypothetical protein
MRELISRDIAEKLIREIQPVQSNIEQTADQISIKIILSNGQILSVQYQPKLQNKQYFILSH